VAFALVTAALIWTGGAALAGSSSWGFTAASGFASTTVVPTAIAGSTIAAGGGLLYGALNVLGHGGSLTSPQRGWCLTTITMAGVLPHDEMLLDS